MAEKNHEVEWSKDECSIKEAVNKLGTPCMVKVVSGCSDPAFAKGNLLKLDFGINIRKVVAKFVLNGSAQKEEILIPLGYKGKVSKVQEDVGTKVYTKVSELIKELPRYVQTEEALSAADAVKDSPLKIEPKQKLEILNVSGTDLVCAWQNKTIKIASSAKINCRLMEDDSEYTFYDVIDRNPLPMTVKIKEPNFLKVTKLGLSLAKEVHDKLSDTVKLARITNHEVIVGVLKAPLNVGPDAGMQTLKKLKQTICIFMLTSASVNDIRVQIPKDKKSSSYKFTMTRMFPAEVERSLVNESLFVDLASTINIQILKDEGWTAVKVEKKKPLSKEIFEKGAPSKSSTVSKNKDAKKQDGDKDEDKKETERITEKPDVTKSPSASSVISLIEQKYASKAKCDKKTKRSTSIPEESSEFRSQISAIKTKSPETKRSASLAEGHHNASHSNAFPLSLQSKTSQSFDIFSAKDKSHGGWRTDISHGVRRTPTPEVKRTPTPQSSSTEELIETDEDSDSADGEKYDDARVAAGHDDQAYLALFETPPPVPYRGTHSGPQRKTYKKPESSNDDYEQPVRYSPESVYDQIDYVPRTLEVPTKKEEEKKSKKPGFFSFLSKDKEKKEKHKKEKVTLKGAKYSFHETGSEIFSKEDRKSRQSKPIASVLPSTKETTTPISSETPSFPVDDDPGEFENLSVNQLAEKLIQLELKDLACLCIQEKLDGKFFMSISADELQSSPFSLTELEKLKFMKLKNEMWTPKI